jgi:4-amino-4-deoxy-L-arabinose transferase-like glycosyltransferase
MSNRTRADVLLIAGFCAFLFFYGAGSFGLIGADEPRYAQVAREMLDRHDWITPTLGGRAWLEKPPLYYWQAMLAYSVLGVDDSAARVPSAVDATLLVVAVYLFFRRFRKGAEVDAALITASCAGMIGYARAASMDMALTATFGIGMLSWWAWRESEKWVYLASFYFSIALGMLAKGPVAPFLAGAVVLLFAGITREWKLVARTLWLPGILLFCVVALPWYVAVQVRNPEFFREFFLQHNLARFSSNLYHHPEPFWYYLPVTALALAPWIVFVVAALARVARAWWSERRADEVDLEVQFNIFAACWLIVPMLFFSLSRSKLPGYILPAVPAGAVLLADYLRREMEDDGSVSKGLAVLHSLVAAAPIVPALLIAYVITERRLPAGRPMLIALAVAFVLCTGIALTLVAHWGVKYLRFVTLIPVVLAVAFVLRFGATSLDQSFSARPLALELASVETHRLPLAAYGVRRELEYGLAFYRNQTIARYEAGNVPAGEHLVIAPSDWLITTDKMLAGRRVTFLGHYPAQNVDYYWVSAAATVAHP